MRAVLVIVAEVFRKQPPQMAFVHCNDVVQQVTPTTLNPSLCDAILPRTFNRSLHVCRHRQMRRTHLPREQWSGSITGAGHAIETRAVPVV
jgi:hypothetical protein